jgi:hypothetical protein
VVFVDRLFDRCTLFFPIRHQFVDAARVHHRTGNDVSSDFLPLLENGNRSVFFVRFVEKLAKVISSRKSRCSASDDQCIDFKSFPLGHKMILP